LTGRHVASRLSGTVRDVGDECARSAAVEMPLSNTWELTMFRAECVDES
jgi:hypothetical protein